MTCADRWAAVVIVLGVALAGCSGDDADTSPTTTVLEHDDVVADYERTRSDMATRGGSIVAQLIAGDVAAVYEQTTPEFQSAIPLAEAQRLMAEVTTAAAIGEQTGERTVPYSAERGLYFAEHTWGSDVLRLMVLFDRTGIAVAIEPVTPLPPDPAASFEVHNALRLPFDGLWWITESPTEEVGNHHQAASDQRHAYDFAIWRDGATYQGDGAGNADYWAWGQPVLAPAMAVVVEAVDGVRDNRPQVETNPEDVAGNHVILDLGNGEYAVLGHFQNGSVRVAAGDHVEPGQVLGLTGNSGNSSEPHIHFHLQDGATVAPGGWTGIPARFDHFLADGVAQELGPAGSGRFVMPSEP